MWILNVSLYFIIFCIVVGILRKESGNFSIATLFFFPVILSGYCVYLGLVDVLVVVVTILTYLIIGLAMVPYKYKYLLQKAKDNNESLSYYKPSNMKSAISTWILCWHIDLVILCTSGAVEMLYELWKKKLEKIYNSVAGQK